MESEIWLEIPENVREILDQATGVHKEDCCLLLLDTNEGVGVNFK